MCINQSEMIPWRVEFGDREVTKTPSRLLLAFLSQNNKKSERLLPGTKEVRNDVLNSLHNQPFYIIETWRLSCLERNLKGKSLQKVSQFSCMPSLCYAIRPPYKRGGKNFVGRSRSSTHFLFF